MSHINIETHDGIMPPLDALKITIKKKLVRCITVFSFTFLLSTSALANPVLNNVRSGEVSIQQTPNATVINQSSQKAIINWQSFNIGAHESTHFQQPKDGITLNRINPSQGVSQIYGRLTATGQIILVNPAGIFFGPGSHVNVGGMIATTMNISDHDFLSNYYHFSNAENYNGAIINKGTLIAADNGLIALVGGAVSNEGFIQANMGKVVLASGNAATMSFAGNDLISFTVDSGVTQRAKDHLGNELADGVSTTGSMYANGGSILIAAKDAAAVLDKVINMKGYAQALSASDGSKPHDGEIILHGGTKHGTVHVAGSLNASGEKGGSITITGYQILLDNNSLLNVSGTSGGGTVNIGGGYQGSGSLPHARAVVMRDGAKLVADAGLTGDGGSIILWSDYYTSASGKISARGGELSGNGGLIETSSKNNLSIGQLITDTRAPHGQAGIWLLDPADLTISAGSDSGVTTASPFQPTTSGSVLNVNTLVDGLLYGNVIVQTYLDAQNGNGDIFINTPISYNSVNSLTLSAYRNITSSLSDSIISNAGTGKVVLRADNTGTGTGTLLLTGTTPSITASGGVNIYYNPDTFGTNTALYAGGTTPTQYMLVQSLGSSNDGATTASLGAISNNSSLWESNFALAKDIDASDTSTWNASAGFSPIGNSTTNFSGVFDGLGHTISDLTINRSGTSYQGLFGYTNTTSAISNLNLSNIAVTGNTYVGGLVGYNLGAISNVHITSGSVTGSQLTNISIYVGGLAGLSGYAGTLSNLSNNAAVSAGRVVGGLIGRSQFASLSNVHNTGSVAAPNGANFVGGLIGDFSAGSVTNAYNTGSVTINGSASIVGGLLASAIATNVTLSYNTGDITTAGSTSNLGGLIGKNFNTPVNNAYNTGNISITHGTAVTSTYIGGLIGTSGSTTIYNVYNSGHINLSGTGQTFDIGGLVGRFESSSFSNISNAYNFGNITNTLTVYGFQNGGIVGSANSLVVSNVFSSGNINITSRGDYTGGLVGYAYGGSITNAYSSGNITVGNSSVYIGGLAARTGQTVTNSYSSGALTYGTGSSNIGGLIGSKIFSTRAITNSFWNTETSGVATSAGSSGAAGYRGMTSAQMSDITNFTTPANGFVTASWDIGTLPGDGIWYADGSTFPKLSAFTRLISGTSTAPSGSVINIAAGDTLLTTATVSATGDFNLTLDASLFMGNKPVIFYLNNAAETANTVVIVDGIGGSNLSGSNSIALVNNTVIAGSNGTSGTLSNASMAAALGSLIDADILFNTNNNNLFIDTNKNFQITAGTNYTLDGDISADGGNIDLNGALTVSASSPTISSNATGIITLGGSITSANTVTLNLANTNMVNINGTISLENGSLVLAGNNSNTLFTANQNGNINVKNFNLAKGSWLESSATLSSFRVTNNFLFNSGNGPSSDVSFIRVTGGDGNTNPYQLTDIYGLQGINANTTLLASNYQLMNDIDASDTSSWNGNTGFMAIGATTAFSGSIDGQSYAIDGLTINNSQNASTGFIAETTSTGSISNLGLTGASVTVNNTVNDGSVAAGVLVGRNNGAINNAYARGNLIGGSNNYYLGGLVGINQANGSITNSYSQVSIVTGAGSTNIGGLAGASAGMISSANAQSAITAPGGTNVGGLVGLVSGGSIENTYTTGFMNAADGDNIGGLIGSLNNATVTNSYAASAMSVGNSGTAGGLVGVTTNSTVNNSFWDTDVSGFSISAAGTGQTTANMMTASTFVNAGWDFNSVWSIADGMSYPYLTASGINTSRTISGISSASLNDIIRLVVNGKVIGTTYAGNDGSFKFYLAIDNATLFLLYLDDASIQSNTAAITPDNYANMIASNQVSLLTDTVQVGTAATNSLPVSNSSLSTLKGTLTDTDILFGVTNNDLTVNAGIDFSTTAGTTYHLDGNMTSTSGGSLALAGPATITSVNDMTLTSANNLSLGKVDWSGSNTLNLIATNNIYLNGNITGTSGSLNLTAADAVQSITSGSPASPGTSGVIANINVNNFDILQGRWYQNAADTLPTFTVGTNFQLNSGDMSYNLPVEFIRAQGGSGTTVDPFLITDMYGLQGIGSNSTTLAQSFTLADDIDAASASSWNNGAGFLPIGHYYWSAFTGTFDGGNHTISNLTINQTGLNADYVALFAAVESPAVIKNITLNNPTTIADGYNNNSNLIGYGEGVTIDNITINNGSVTNGRNYMGAVAGYLYNATVSNITINDTTVTSLTGKSVGSIAGHLRFNSSLMNAYIDNVNLYASTGEVGGAIGGVRDGVNMSNVHVSNSTIDGNNSRYVGGVTGWYDNAAVISNLSSTNNIISGSDDVGGISGYFYANTSLDGLQVTNSMVTGSGSDVGGIAGYIGYNAAMTANDLHVTNTTVSGDGLYIGGVAGFIYIMTSFTNSSVTGGSVIGRDYVGGITGWTDTVPTLTNLHNYGTPVTGKDNISGVLGYAANATLTNASNSGVITTTKNYGNQIGGIIGEADTMIVNTASNSGLITVGIGASTGSLGGIAGFIDASTITNASNTGNVIANSNSDSAGGIVAIMNNSTVTESYNTGNITSGSTVGGIAGFQQSASNISYSYNTGNILTTYGEAAGISGAQQSNSIIDHVYNTGSVTNNGTFLNAGLMSGISANITAGGTISNAYNFGYVNSTIGGSSGNSTGGILGTNSGTAFITNVYNIGYIIGGSTTGAIVGNAGTVGYTGNVFWNSQTSGVTKGVGNLSSDPASIMSHTTASMKQQATYTNFDFSSGSANWNIIENVSYPFMQFFYPTTTELRVLSGTTDLGGGGQVNIAYNGIVIDHAFTGADGSIYFLEGDNALSSKTVIADNDLFMAFYYAQPTVSNYIENAPAGFASVTNINLGSNDLIIASGNPSNTNLAALIGSMSTTDILFSLTGNDLTLGNAAHPASNLIVEASATYNINGNISSYDMNNGSSVTFNGPALISADAIVNLGNGNITIGSTLNGAQGLTLTTSGAINLGGNLGNLIPLNSLTLSGNGATQINSTGITTTGAQNYLNPTTLGTNTLMTMGTGSTLTMNNSLSGAGFITTMTGAGNNTYSFLSAFTLLDAVQLQVTGGGSNNTINADNNSARVWNITTPNTGNVASLNMNFASIQNLTGGNTNDHFILSGTGTLSGALNGGGGANQLNSSNSASFWTINNNNGGFVNNAINQSTPGAAVFVGSFANIQNLMGGAGLDVFNFQRGFAISGSVNGGDTTNLNTARFDHTSFNGQILKLYLSPPVGGVIDAGSVYNAGNSLIASLVRIQQSNGNSLGTIILPASKVNDPNLSVTYYDSTLLNGEIADPFYFYGWNVGNMPSPPATQPSSVIAQVNQQPETNAKNNNDYSTTYSDYGSGDPDVLNKTSTNPLLNTTSVKAGSACYRVIQ